MDYYNHRTAIDGNGMILDTTPGSPDLGSYVTEDELKAWIKAGICNSGYYYNGNFYKESTHVNVIPKTDGALYVDMTNTNKALYTCISSTYYSLTEEAQIQQVITNLQNGTLVPLKAVQDQNGAVIDTTYAKKTDYVPKADIVDNLTTQDATKPLSANQGYVLDGKITNVKNACEQRDSALSKRVANLEQKAGDEFDITYPDTSEHQCGMDEVPPNVAKYAKGKTLIGVTRGKNQKLSNWNFAVNWGSTGASSSVSSNVLTFTASVSGGRVNAPCDFLDGHRYLVAVEVNLTTATDKINLYANGGYGSAYTESRTGWQQIFAVATGHSNDAQTFIIRDTRTSDWDAVQCRNAIVRDLNQYFSGDSSVDPTTLTKAIIQTKYPELLIPSDYDAGSLDSTTYSGIESEGFNLFDVSKAVANERFTSSGTSTASGTSRSVYIKVKPNQDYYFKNVHGGSTMSAVYWFDADKNYISNDALGLSSPQSGVRTSPPNAFYVGINYATSQTEVCVNVSQTNTGIDPHNGDFVAYTGDTISLPSPVELRSAGSVHETLDVESGVKTRPLGIIEDLSSLDWVTSGSSKYAIVNLRGFKRISPSVVGNGIASNYTVTSYFTSTVTEGALGWYNDGTNTILNVYGSTTPSGSLLYELDTPLADEQLTPVLDPFIEVEGDGTIRPTQSQNTKIDSSMTAEYLSIGA